MGYTHYWELSKDSKALSKQCLEDVKKVIEQHKKIIQFEDDNNKEPIVTNTAIRFNGIGENGHETFYFETPPKEDEYRKFREGVLFSFCKTAKKPYDIVVCKLLLILKADLQKNMKLSSDGFSNYTCSFDGVWSEAIEKVKEMGYKINCSTYARDKGESPYYDCEIYSVERR